MEKAGLNQLREMFQDFYVEKEHYKRKSFSLIPEKDKSLLIINSGMAPLKPYFSGAETPPSKRMTTCQKCIRTGDIENVGYTARHATFFEMLGSFSFGDYFKLESITWGWEFIKDVLQMPLEKVWASVYEEDDEAFDIWHNVIGLPEERIVKLGKDDNFWEIGTGPCGPCSELYFDRGEKYGCDNPNCKPGCDCDRYVEFWNHVFTQFNRDDAGNYSKLTHPNIDTGMGLERLACIVQGVDSIFDIDTIRYILDKVTAKSGVAYHGGTVKTDVSTRIITDHIRSVVFMIGDGIIPSNEGRGYVLRRLLRRAARHGRLLGIKEAFLAELAGPVIDVSGGAYPELEERRAYIHKIISVEEDKFAATIDQGTSILAEYIDGLKTSGQPVLDGAKIFKLYDTFGFPFELTSEILEENGCTADVEGFNENMLHQRETARAARKSDESEGWNDNQTDYLLHASTVFTGYEKVLDEAEVVAIFKDKKSISAIEQGDVARIALSQTPFYAESGGQASDVGMLYNDNSALEVQEVVKFQNIFAHKVKVHKGTISVGEKVTCMIAVPHRNHIARNHTATHILHKALIEVVGDHVQQAGSSVSAEGLRFDFTHFEAVSKDDLNQVEEIVNDKINHFLSVDVAEMSVKDALKAGATALFGEKYGDTVRVVSVGDFSKELCGGTHVSNSGQIGAFKIVSEGGVAAGVRRIEAITGIGVLKRLEEREETIRTAAETLKSVPSALLQKIVSVSEESKAVKKELEEYKRKAVGSKVDQMIADAQEVGGVKLITQAFRDYSVADLRTLSDDLRAASKGIVVVLATENEGKVTFLVSVAEDLLDKGIHAGNMVKQIAAVAGGSGGGKADMAQAGAKDPGKIQDALALAKTLLQ